MTTNERYQLMGLSVEELSRKAHDIMSNALSSGIWYGVGETLSFLETERKRVAQTPQRGQQQ